MRLTVSELMSIKPLIPQEGTLDTQAIVSEMLPKIKLLPGDKEAIEYRRDPSSGVFTFDQDLADEVERDIPLSGPELEMLRNRITDLSAKGKLPTVPLAFCTLCRKIRDAGKITERKK